MRGDTDQAQSALVRQQVAAEAARQSYWLALDHASFPGIGHVRATAQGYEWGPLNYSLTGAGQ